MQTEQCSAVMAPASNMDWVTARNRKDKVVDMMKRGEWRAVIQVQHSHKIVHY